MYRFLGELVTEPPVSNYQIYLDDELFETVSAGVTSLEIVELAPKTSLLWRVEAVGPSGLVSFDGPTLELMTPDLEQPVWPLDGMLRAQGIGETSLTLTWTAYSPERDAATYEVFQDNTLIDTVIPPQRSLVVSNLSPGITYEFSVQVRGATGLSSVNGPRLTVQTNDRTAPSGPGAVISIDEISHQRYFELV